MLSSKTDYLSDIKYINALRVTQRILFASDIARLVFHLNKCTDLELPYRAVSVAEKYVFGRTSRISIKEEASKTMSIMQNSDNKLAKKILSVAIEVLMTALALPEKKSESVWDVMLLSGIVFENTNMSLKDLWSKYNAIYIQAKPKRRPKLPITSELRAIAMDIVETRNFDEYNVLLDNLDENHGIALPREVPLGLSHYVLFTLTNTN